MVMMALALRNSASKLGGWIVEKGRQLLIESLRKRAIPKNRVPNESQQQSTNGHVNLVGPKESLYPDISKGILWRYATGVYSRAAVLQRSAILMRRSALLMRSRTSSRNVLGFAFLGLALVNDTNGKENDSAVNVLPLDICCQVIKNTFQKSSVTKQPDFPSDIASYDLCPQLLSKGCSAAIYAAKVKDTPQYSRNSSRSDLDNFEVVAMETTPPDSDESSEDRDFVFLNVDGERKVLQEQGSQLKSGQPAEEFDLAVKMMFNYDAKSNVMDISRAFEREYLPLQREPSELGETSMLQWQNGNHVKNKKHLLPHPNIVSMYHVFTAPVKVHDLTQARDLFPAALPPRIHPDGYGRNMTMYMVMKRYDMTLKEYTRSIGSPSQHIAMVIIAQLLEAVSYLVANGVAHRDLKSNNILVNLDPGGGSPHVVLADFGCALADSDVGLELPFPSSFTDIGGNTALMAPEIKLSKYGPGASISYTKSDAWAIGAIAYEVLGLRNPFYRHDNQSGLDSADYCQCDLPPLPDNTHPGLARVVKLLLRKNLGKRPTPQVAANMLHMSLWQPESLTNACWESGHVLPTKHHVTNWLLRISMATQDDDQREVSVQRLWHNITEHQLCKSWLSRVDKWDLMKAAYSLHGICLWETTPNEG